MVRVAGLFTCHTSPPFGLEILIVLFAGILNTALLASRTKVSVVRVTRTKACVLGVLGTLHEYEEAVVLLVITFQLVPLFKLYSTFQGPVPAPAFDHDMVCVVQPIQFSAPFGEVTVTDGYTILKVVLLWSVTTGLLYSVTRTKA